jgi:hypothetical protein
MTDDRPPTVVVTPSQGVVGVAFGAIDALRSTPILLVVVLLNCGFLGVAAYYLRTQQAAAFQLVGKVLDRCLPEHPHSGPQP